MDIENKDHKQLKQDYQILLIQKKVKECLLT
jgi:hypothetical protein